MLHINVTRSLANAMFVEVPRTHIREWSGNCEAIV